MRRWLAGVAGLALGLMVTAFWLGLDARLPEPPAFERVREQWKPSELFLLDRDGVVIQERRVDPRRRRLDWVASTASRSAGEMRCWPPRIGASWLMAASMRGPS